MPLARTMPAMTQPWRGAATRRAPRQASAAGGLCAGPGWLWSIITKIRAGPLPRWLGGGASRFESPMSWRQQPEALALSGQPPRKCGGPPRRPEAPASSSPCPAARGRRPGDEAGPEDLRDLIDAVAFALRPHAEAVVAAEIAGARCRRETRARGRARAVQPECEATGTASGRVAKLTTAETTTLTISAAKPMLMSLALAGRNGNRLTNVPWGVNVT